VLECLGASRHRLALYTIKRLQSSKEENVLPSYVSGFRALGLTFPASVKRSKLRCGLTGPAKARRRIEVPLFTRNNSLGIVVKDLMYFDMLRNKG
jgi:hypothetical protein